MDKTHKQAGSWSRGSGRGASWSQMGLMGERCGLGGMLAGVGVLWEDTECCMPCQGVLSLSQISWKAIEGFWVSMCYSTLVAVKNTLLISGGRLDINALTRRSTALAWVCQRQGQWIEESGSESYVGPKLDRTWWDMGFSGLNYLHGGSLQP